MSSLPRRRTVADVMTTSVHIAGPQTPFKLLVRLIEENRVSAIPIVDQQGMPIGIVSEADLLLKERRAELEHQDLGHVRKRREQRTKADAVVASELMTSPPITVPATATLPEAARLMQERNLRRLVVVDGGGRIAGIVSRSDLLQVFLRTDEDLRREVKEVLIPAVLLEAIDGLHVEVRWNVVTLSGELDRLSDARMLARMTRDIDGVVSVIDHLTYRWDDTRVPAGPVGPAGPVEIDRRFAGF
jgi:CBS domain-containing protein